MFQCNTLYCNTKCSLCSPLAKGYLQPCTYNFANFDARFWHYILTSITEEIFSSVLFSNLIVFHIFVLAVLLSFLYFYICYKPKKFLFKSALEKEL